MDCSAVAAWIAKGELKDFWLPLIQLLSPFLAAWMILIQINRNHSNNIKLQIEKQKDEVKNRLYDEIDKKMEAANDAVNEAIGYVHKIFFSLSSQQATLAAGFVPPIIDQRVPQIIALQHKAATKIADLISVIEKYEIVQPELKIFQKALNVCGYDIREAFSPFFQMAVPVLPAAAMRNNEGKIEEVVLPKPLPSKEQIETFKKLGDLYQEALRNFFGVTFDFRVEIQNLLLSHVFGRKVSPRQPLNPSIKVITTDAANIKKLDRYFDEDTAWGKNKAETERRVKESFKKQ